jgi:ABC-type oligopeptide transport system, periplasmic component
MTAFVALNTQKKPLDNQKVRAALNMAFDRTTYLKRSSTTRRRRP